MRKTITIIISLLITILIVLGVISMLQLFQKPESSEQTHNTLHWLPEESNFVDYEIVGDNIKFRYAITFVNNFPYDSTISLSAKFSPKELKGWIEADDFIIGCDENDIMITESIVKGQKKKIIFTFTGKYLGGKIPQKLSFPQEIIMMS